MMISGKVAAVLGANIDTDVIFPTRYVASFDAVALAPHIFEDVMPELYPRLGDGGILVGGPNFGCGSAREQAASSLRAAKVRLILAPCFSRSFYRNALNVGLPVLEAERLPKIAAGDELEVEVEAGRIRNRTTGEETAFEPPAPFLIQLIRAGGIVNLYRETDCYRSLSADRTGE